VAEHLTAPNDCIGRDTIISTHRRGFDHDGASLAVVLMRLVSVLFALLALLGVLATLVIAAFATTPL
jgi:hypothetical protein